MTTTRDRIPAEPEGIGGLLDRLSHLALVATLVRKVQIAVDAILTDTAIGPDLRSWLARSKGLFIAPDILPGALIPGGACGGVLMARAPDGSDWNGPSFHLLGGVALDLEPARRSSTIFLMAMTEGGLSAFSSNLEPRGPDIVGFVLSAGTRSSLAIHRAVITACDGLNHAVYGRGVTPAEIIRGAAGRGRIGVVLHAPGAGAIG